MRPRVKYQIIYRHRTEYPVAVMCKFFAVSRSGYYAFVHRLGKPEKDAALAGLIAQQRERSFRTYGYRRMWLWLKNRTAAGTQLPHLRLPADVAVAEKPEYFLQP